MTAEDDQCSWIAPSRLARRYPMTASPAGWFLLLASDELEVKQVRTLKYFGREFVVYRDERRQAHVFDPHCAHLGAHLGGGRVIGCELVCPYHEWRYGADGRCTHVPFGPKVSRARIRSWPVREVNGLLFLHFDAAGGPPRFDVPALPEWASDEWSKYERLSVETTGHVLELQENLLDETHFVTIHHRMEPLAWDFVEDGPLASARARMRVPVLGSMLDFDVRADFVGPGMIVLRTVGLIEHTVLSMGTPIDDERAHYRLFFLTKKPKGLTSIGALLNRLLRMYARGDFLREVRIWERRLYPEVPILSPIERSIPKYRRWYRQFCASGDRGVVGDAAEQRERSSLEGVSMGGMSGT